MAIAGREGGRTSAATLAILRLILAISNWTLVRFLLVGVSNTVISLAAYWLLLLVGVPYPVAGFLGYGAGIVNGYTWNRIWTFEAGTFQKHQFARYGVVQIGAAAANAGGLAVAVQGFGFAEVPAELAILPSLTLITFVINREWTFRR